jgi:hypothetical protein
MVVNTYNPRLKRLGQEDCEFKSSLGYIARSASRRKKKNRKEKEKKNEKLKTEGFQDGNS